LPACRIHYVDQTKTPLKSRRRIGIGSETEGLQVRHGFGQQQRTACLVRVVGGTQRPHHRDGHGTADNARRLRALVRLGRVSGEILVTEALSRLHATHRKEPHVRTHAGLTIVCHCFREAASSASPGPSQDSPAGSRIHPATSGVNSAGKEKLFPTYVAEKGCQVAKN